MMSNEISKIIFCGRHLPNGGRSREVGTLRQGSQQLKGPKVNSSQSKVAELLARKF